jgi:hypothetical protein
MILVIVGLIILGLLPDLFDYMRVRQLQDKPSSKSPIKRYGDQFAAIYKRVKRYLPH